MIKPLKDNVLVEFIEGQDIKKSGLIISHKQEEKPQIAKVISVGENVKQVLTGDFVIVGRYVGNKIDYENVEYIILKEKEILAKVEL